MTQTRLSVSPILRYAAVLVVVVICVYAAYCWFCSSGSPTTVFVVRHAEKSAVGGTDPPLSAAGQDRAQQLSHVLGDAGVTAVFATEFVRTQQTVQPTANAAGLPVLAYAAGDAAALAETIRTGHAGGVVLVAGHSNTVSAVVEALGGAAVGLLDESDFDNLFQVTVRRCGGVRVLHLKYGAPT